MFFNYAIVFLIFLKFFCIYFCTNLSDDFCQISQFFMSTPSALLSPFCISFFYINVVRDRLLDLFCNAADKTQQRIGVHKDDALTIDIDPFKTKVSPAKFSAFLQDF